MSTNYTRSGKVATTSASGSHSSSTKTPSTGPPNEAELVLIQKLKDAPRSNAYRYSEKAEASLLEALFLSLAGYRQDYLKLLFPKGLPASGAPVTSWNLSEAQGAVEGAEYSAAARGKPCGHIFKSGDATYRCK